MADDEKTIWNDAAGTAPKGTGASRWAEVLGDQGDEHVAGAAAPAPQPEPRPRRTLGGLLQQVVDGARRFPVAFVLVILAWLVSEADILGFNHLGGLTVPVLLSLSGGAAAACAACLALERHDDGRHAWAGIVAPLAATAILLALGVAFCGTDREGFHSLLAAGVFGVSAFGSLWLLCTDNNEDVIFAELVRAVGFSLLMAVLLTFALLVCLLALDELLGIGGANPYLSVLTAAWTLVFPILVLSQLPHHTDAPQPGKAYRAVAGYVVLPLCLALLAILYGYIVRIVAEGQMPSGQMNWFGSFALLVGIALWLGLRPIENRPAQLFVRWGWALILPVTAVQAYCVWVRFCAYGLTEVRCAGMACLVVGFFGLVLAAWQQSPRKLFSFAAVVCAIVCLTPLNVIDLANAQQVARLKQGLVRQDDQQAYDSWEYLRYSGRGYFDMGLADIVDPDTFEGNPGTPDDEGPFEQTWHIWYANQTPLDVSGYARLYALEDAAVEVGSNPAELTLTWSDGTTVTVDFNEFIDWLPEEGEEMAPADLTIELDDGSALALSNLEADYEGDEVTYVWPSGWYLVP